MSDCESPAAGALAELPVPLTCFNADFQSCAWLCWGSRSDVANRQLKASAMRIGETLWNLRRWCAARALRARAPLFRDETRGATAPRNPGSTARL
jgi:hypothetical protein